MSDEDKKKYQRPTAKPVDNISSAKGDCSPTGPTDTGYCATGEIAGGYCNPGITAFFTCTPGTTAFDVTPP